MAPLTFFHGTSNTHLESIFENGLSVPCLTDIVEVAEYFAEVASELDGGEPVVFSVEVKDTSNLRADAVMIEEPILRGRLEEFYERIAEETDLRTEEAVRTTADKACERSGVKSWDDLPFDLALEIAGGVYFAGIIPGTNISEVVFV